MTREKTGLTIEQIVRALRAKAGNVTEAAKALGVARQHLHRRINDSPTLQQVLQDSREELVDIAELALRREVIAGNMTAIIWTLKASPAAKARGWSERQEITGKDGGSLRIAIEYVDAEIDAATPARGPADGN